MCEFIRRYRQRVIRTLGYHGQVLADIVIRHPEDHEHRSVRQVITAVANETFGSLFAPNPVPLDFEKDDLALAWVAVRHSTILGVVLTEHDLVSDLWVVHESRKLGVGSRLLAQGEAEVVARGYRACRLRVVKSNTVAVEFYLHRDWRIAREFPHEKFGHAMLEMVKSNQG